MNEQTLWQKAGTDTSQVSDASAHENAAATAQTAAWETEAASCPGDSAEEGASAMPETVSFSDAAPMDAPAEEESCDNVPAALEAILFAAGCPVSYEKLGEALGMTPGDIKWLAASLKSKYEERGIELITYEDSCRLCTRARYEKYIKSALNLRRTGMLSASALETLAVVAYHQPVTRAYIEQIRGVDSSYAVSSLVDKGLIESKGRLDVPGRPSLYGTTENFLRCFGIESLDQLPKTSL